MGTLKRRKPKSKVRREGEWLVVTDPDDGTETWMTETSGECDTHYMTRRPRMTDHEALEILTKTLAEMAEKMKALEARVSDLENPVGTIAKTGPDAPPGAVVF